MAKIIIGAAMVAGAVTAEVLTAGAATPLAAYAMETGIAMGASLLLAGIASLFQPNVGTEVNSKNPVEPWQVVYGRSRVSGPVISICENGSNNKFLHMIIPFAGHQIGSVDALYLNGYQCYLDGTGMNGGGQALPGKWPDPNNPGATYGFYRDDNPRVYADFFLGTQTQEASSFFIENGPSGYWTSDCTLTGIAYAYIRLWWNTAAFPNGIPEIKFDIHGKNDIYDPRTSTNGYSENPALCISDYLCNANFGLNCDYASEIDQTALITAANVCDTSQALAPGRTEPLFTCNGAFKTSQTRGDVIQNMLSCMGGNISYVAGLWKIYAAAWRGWSGTTLTQSDFAGPIEWKPLRERRDLFNAVRGTFISPNFVNDVQYGPGYNPADHPGVVNQFAGEWLSTDVPIYMEDSTHGYGGNLWYTDDGDEYLYQDTNFPFVISCRQAQQLAKVMLERNRQQGTGTLVCGLSAYGIQPLDIIQVTYPRFGWANKLLEVTGTRLVVIKDDDGKPVAPTFEIDVCETAARVYEWSTTEELTIQGGTSPALPNPAAITPYPTTVTLASGPAEVLYGADGRAITQILVTWDQVPSGYVQSGGHIVIQLQNNGSTAWNTIATISGDSTQYLISPVTDGAYYNVQICAVTAAQVASDWVEVGPIMANNSISTFNSSDILNGQGSLVPTQDVTFTATGTISGTTETVTWVCSATTLPLPSGANIIIPATTKAFTGLTFSTDYYWYPAWDIATSTIVWPGNANDGPSTTSLNLQMADGYIPLNLLTFTTGTGTGGTGGTGTGGGSNPCPEADEPVTTWERGTIRCGDVLVGERLKGLDIPTGTTVYRTVIAKRTEYASLWATVDGHRISPFDEIWRNGWIEAHEASSEPLSTDPGERVQLTVEATDHDGHNYFVGDLLIHNARTGAC